MGGSQNQGYHFACPSNKDYNILGSILGSPYFGKLPYRDYIIGVIQGLDKDFVGILFPSSLRAPSKLRVQDLCVGLEITCRAVNALNSKT